MVNEGFPLSDHARPTVLLADDHPLIRVAVREDLEHDGFFICAEVESATEAIAAAVREQPDLCLLDVYMPGSGLRAAAEIHALVPSARIVMLTASSDESHMREAARVGARGYLLKDIEPSRLSSILRDVLADVRAFPHDLVDAPAAPADRP